MKFGLRTPSLKKRFAARTSLKRYVRHNMGIKAPRGAGFITHPKKAMYNKIYNKTSFSIDSLGKAKKPKNSTLPSHASNPNNNQDTALGCLTLISIVLIFTAPPVGIVMFIAMMLWAIKIQSSPKYKAKQKVKKAKKFLNQDNYDKAEELFNQAFELDNSSDEAILFIGLIAHDKGDFVKSENYLSRYLVANPYDLFSQFFLAKALYQQEKYEEAIPILQKITEDHPKYLQALQLLGGCFAALGKYDMAIDTFKRGPLRKRNLDLELLEFHYNFAELYEALGDTKNAKKHYKKVYATDATYRDVASKIS